MNEKLNLQIATTEQPIICNYIIAYRIASNDRPGRSFGRGDHFRGGGGGGGGGRGGAHLKIAILEGALI